MRVPPLLRRLGALALLLGLIVVAPLPASAQAPATGPTVEQLQAMVATLKDPAQREKLVEQLQVLIAAQQKTPATVKPSLAETLLSGVSGRIDAVATDTVEVVRFLVDLPRLYGWFERLMTDPERRAAMVELLLGVVIVIGAGILAEFLTRRVLRRPRRAVETRASTRLWERTLLLVARGVIELLPLLAFTAAAYSVLPLVEMRSGVRYAVLDVIVASVAARLMALAARLILSPRFSGNRMVPITPETAGYLYVWIRRLAYISIYGWFAADALRYVGLPIGAHAMLLRLVGLAVTGLIIVMILQNRAAVGAAIAGDGTAGHFAGLGIVRARLGEVWHVLTIVYVLGIYLVWALDVRGGFGYVFRATTATIVVLVIARLLMIGLHLALDRIFSIGADMEARYPGLEARANRYLPLVRTAFIVVIYVVATLAILQAWGANSFSWVSSQGGVRIVGSAARIGLLLLATVIAWEMLSALLVRYLNRPDANGLRLADRSSRARTLFPLLRTSIAIALSIVTVLMVLSEIGVDIAPLLAGAGILGIAIGFGSQTLVKDVITGFFMLVEDTIAVGDVVDLGSGNSGSVETITIRTIKLRNGNGTLLTIPFSEVKTVRNMTKDFSHVLLDLGIGYRENPDRVLAVLKKVAESVVFDSDVAALCLPPPEVQGPIEFKDSSIIYRLRIKTLPGKQWAVSRELNRRVKIACDEEDIELPFPSRTIYEAHPAMPPTAQPGTLPTSAPPTSALPGPLPPSGGPAAPIVDPAPQG